MATRTIKSAAGKSDLTVAAVRTAVRNTATDTHEATLVAGRSGAFRTNGRNTAPAAPKAPHTGASNGKRRKH